MARNFQNQRTRKQQPKQNFMKLGIALPYEISESLSDEIMEVLKSIPFNKVSIPVSTYRYLVEDDIAADDNRVITTGYIKGFDVDTETFTVVLFSNNREKIEKFTNPMLEIVFSEYNGKLGVITKFNIVPIEDAEEEETTEAPVEEEPVIEQTESAE